MSEVVEKPFQITTSYHPSSKELAKRELQFPSCFPADVLEALPTMGWGEFGTMTLENFTVSTEEKTVFIGGATVSDNGTCHSLGILHVTWEHGQAPHFQLQESTAADTLMEGTVGLFKQSLPGNSSLITGIKAENNTEDQWKRQLEQAGKTKALAAALVQESQEKGTSVLWALESPEEHKADKEAPGA